MKKELTIQGIETRKELELRKKLWTTVLEMMNAEPKDMDSSDGLCQYVKCALINDEQLRTELPSHYLSNERKFFPELIAYRPNSYWKNKDIQTRYWYNPYSVKAYEKRKRIVESIIRDLTHEIESRISMIEKKNEELKNRLELWKNVKKEMIKQGVCGTSGLCRFINLHRFINGRSLFPPATDDMNRINYPEMNKYFPGEYYYGSYYWWSPYTAESYEKRMNVVDNIIRDLSKKIKRTKTFSCQ